MTELPARYMPFAACTGKTGWKTYFLPKPFRRPVLQRQLPAVTFHDFLGDRQSEAGAEASLAPRRINPEKRLEDA